jgi:hypothetical protein
MGALLQAQSTGMDGAQTGSIASQSEAAQDLAHLLEAQDHRKLFLTRGADEGERAPLTFETVVEEELDAAKSNGAGSAGKLPDLFEVEEILPKLFLGDLIGGFAVVFGKLVHGPDVHFLSGFGQAPELKVLDHSFFEICHGLASCVWG